MARAKKQNFISAYFSHFGLKQICDILMFGGAIVLIVGLCTKTIVITVGLGIYIAAALIALCRAVKVLFSKINKRSPEYKNAIINTIVMCIILALAIFGLVYSIMQ